MPIPGPVKTEWRSLLIALFVVNACGDPLGPESLLDGRWQSTVAADDFVFGGPSPSVSLSLTELGGTVTGTGTTPTDLWAISVDVEGSHAGADVSLTLTSPARGWVFQGRSVLTGEQ